MSRRITARASSRSQPRPAKSASALLTVSLEAPNELREFLLGEVVHHVDALLGLHSEAS